ncbi:MAG: hypothetical protein LRY41_00830 [Candidatus Pacebacteria bacterium]|nr:hypothetical protein [Candidatus Paceibacterota bacterium]MCD8527865.1 hypothetical protein [Candidatus Paceibacterota bacterium]MCD8564019.1 hypothetical protein [Candidatus Paceibacterota bacterium]
METHYGQECSRGTYFQWATVLCREDFSLKETFEYLKKLNYYKIWEDLIENKKGLRAYIVEQYSQVKDLDDIYKIGEHSLEILAYEIDGLM